MKKIHAMLLVSLAFLVVSSVAASDSAGAPRITSLRGAEEVPPADPDGTGFAVITLNVGRMRVCWDLTVSDIEPAFAAHIHAAPAGVNGPVVVPLSPPTTGSSTGCTDGVDPVLVQNIVDHPDQYYVNVHNAVFPGGAVRGQLSNPGQAD